MDTIEEREIQLHGDEQDEAEGEVFLGDVPAEESAAAVDETPADSSALPATEAIAQAAAELDAERAGDAAKPQYQPSIPGILPPFDWRRAQLTTESLEENVASAERVWESLKKQTASAKGEFDDAVESLRNHIQETHRLRVDTEFQVGRTVDADGATVIASSCLYEKTTWKPCRICRAPNVNMAGVQPETVRHIAIAACTATFSEAGADAAELREALYQVTGIAIEHATVVAWTLENQREIGAWLERWTGAQDANEDPRGLARPVVIGHPHEAGLADEVNADQQACRVCGGRLAVFRDGVGTWPAGQLVGTDCPGEPAAEAEPTRVSKPRHAKKADRQKAKQASGDHAAEQVAEGKKKTTSKRKPRA